MANKITKATTQLELDILNAVATLAQNGLIKWQDARGTNGAQVSLELDRYSDSRVTDDSDNRVTLRIFAVGAPKGSALTLEVPDGLTLQPEGSYKPVLCTDPEQQN